MPGTERAVMVSSLSLPWNTNCSSAPISWETGQILYPLPASQLAQRGRRNHDGKGQEWPQRQCSVMKADVRFLVQHGQGPDSML